MIGILAEKSSAARSFANALGGMRGSFEGEPYVITASAGHLYEFFEPHEMVPDDKGDQYKYWNIKNLPWDERDFHWKKRIKKDTKSGYTSASKRMTEIKNVLKDCDEIVIATDVDPSGEGDLLAWEILQNIPLRGKKVTRMYHNDESEKEVIRAFKERKEIPDYRKDALYKKADFRSKWDYLSMQWTRVATACGDGKSVLRNGRLKSVMVVFVGDALKEIAEYKKTPFYQNRFKDENGIIYENKKEPTYKTREEVPSVYKPSDVIVDKTEMKASPPPKLLDLMGIAAALSSKGIKSDEVLKVYQDMYSDSIVSYPRTEDDVITPGQFDEMLKLVPKIAAVVGVDPALLTHKSQRSTHVRLENSRKKKVSHGANRPGTKVPNSLDDLKKYGKCAPAIYDLLAHNFLAMFAEDYKYEQQNGHVKDYPDFKGVAKVPKSLGWKLVYNEEKVIEEDDTSKGLGKKAEPFVYEGFNKKPPTPTMKWLQGKLEKHDVGTGATRTSIYAEVTNEKSKYPLLKDTKGKISMTPFGEMNYKLLENTHIGDVTTTEMLMAHMREVETGKADADKYLHDIQQMIIDDIETMKKNRGKLGNTQAHAKGGNKKGMETDIKCSCGGTVHENESEYGKYYRCQGCGKTVNAVFLEHKFTKAELKDLFEDKTIGPAKFHSSKKDKDFNAYGSIVDGRFKLEFKEEPAVVTKVHCSKCDGVMILKKGNYGEYYECTECRHRFSKKVCEHNFTEDEVIRLFRGEKIGPIDFVSRAGKAFTAECSLNEEGKISFDFTNK